MERRIPIVDYESTGIALRDKAQNLTIHNQSEYDYAAEFLLAVKSRIKEIETAMQPQCHAAYESWQTALNQKKKYIQPLADAEAIAKAAISDYHLSQQALSEAAERKAREEALKQEEKEKKRLIKQGRGDEVDLVFVPVVAPDHSVTKINGVSTVESIDINIINMKEFVSWLTTTELDLSQILSVKIGVIKQYVKMTKVKKIPGCQLVPTMTVSAKV